jgi:hypothetical protein
VVDVLDKVMEFPQMGSGPNRQQIIDALRNTAQSASNNIAETASMPVDALAWALRKVGLPVGDKPVMGSDWMREKGLTAPVQEGASKVVGDTIGMISPMGLSKQGAKAMIDAGSKLKGLPVGMSIKDVGASAPQEMLTSVNPTGSIFTEYTPQLRATQPLSKNMVSLAETMGANPDEFVTIYRGAPSSQKSIVPGDFITDNAQLAKDYAGSGKVLQMKVRRGDVLDNLDEPLGGEYIYRPSAKK